MRIKVLASGSKGNSTLIISNDTKILIDVGISYSKIKKYLVDEDINISELNAIIITHAHKDHILGLASLIKKENLLVYIKSDHYEEIKKIINPDNIVIVDKDVLEINDLKIEYLRMSHDTFCYSFIISDGYKKIYYVTDTGYINRRYKSKIKNMDMYLIEANHNETMLMEGPYPLILKQRVVSDTGHMSNKYVASLLKEIVGENTEYIVLMHISENNNTEEAALTEVSEELEKIFYNKELIAAKQYEAMEIIEI